MIIVEIDLTNINPATATTILATILVITNIIVIIVRILEIHASFARN
jgi:hypothetical protein